MDEITDDTQTLKDVPPADEMDQDEKAALRQKKVCLGSKGLRT
jgi:hypothetical protein